MSIYDKSINNVAAAALKIMAEKLHPNQQKLDVHEPEKDKLTADDFKKLRSMKKEDVGLDEGKMGQLSADLTDLSHADFHKEYGKPKSHFDPTNFKKPVQKGKEMDRAKALAQRGMASVKKEEVEDLDEGTMTGITLGQKVKNKQGGYNQDVHHKGEKIGHIGSYKHRTGMRYGGTHDATGDMTAGNRDAEESIADIRFSHAQHLKDTKVKKEQVEELQEYQSKDGVYKHQGTYGRAKGAEHGDTDYDKENEMAKSLDKPKKPNRAKYGARQNFSRSTRVNEEFSSLINSFKTGGLKGLEEGMKLRKEINEEPDNEQFTKELEDQKASMEGKKKQPAVAAPATQGVKQMPEEYEVIDANEINGVTIDTIEERSLSEPEAKKKEEMVKGMKKKLSGFKDRYGDRAKEVMYATATKMAKED